MTLYAHMLNAAARYGETTMADHFVLLAAAKAVLARLLGPGGQGSSMALVYASQSTPTGTDRIFIVYRGSR